MFVCVCVCVIYSTTPDTHTYTHAHTHTHTTHAYAYIHPCCLTCLDGEVIVLFHDINSLVHCGPTSLGRVVRQDNLKAGLESANTSNSNGVSEIWPLNTSDLIEGVRTTGIRFQVQSGSAGAGWRDGNFNNSRASNSYPNQGPDDSSELRSICLALNQDLAVVLASTLLGHATLFTGECSLAAAPSIALSTRQKTPSPPSKPAAHNAATTRENARSLYSPNDRYGERDELRSARNSNLESPMQELLRKMNEMQEQLRDFATLKDDVKELKAALVSLSRPTNVMPAPWLISPSFLPNSPLTPLPHPLPSKSFTFSVLLPFL